MCIGGARECEPQASRPGNGSPRVRVPGSPFRQKNRKKSKAEPWKQKRAASPPPQAASPTSAAACAALRPPRSAASSPRCAPWPSAPGPALRTPSARAPCAWGVLICARVGGWGRVCGTVAPKRREHSAPAAARRTPCVGVRSLRRTRPLVGAAQIALSRPLAHRSSACSICCCSYISLSLTLAMCSSLLTISA